MNHIYIVSTIIFGVLSQVIIRWQMNAFGAPPDTFYEKIVFFIQVLFSPWVILAFFFTFLSGLSWMITLTKFELSYAYPFTSSQFIIILLIGAVFFGETFSITKLLGTILVVIGLIITTR